MSLAEHRKVVAQKAGISLERIAIPNQVHGRKVELAVPGKVHEQTDGLITSNPAVVLSLQVADCAPVFFRDPGSGSRGLVHAGWRGLAAGVLSEGVELLKAHGVDLNKVRVAIGPTIEKACYEVGSEVVERFPGSVWESNAHGRYQLDMTGAARGQLVKAGIPAEHILSLDVCTVCDDRCHSYRRDGEQAGRMVALYREVSAERDE